MTGQTIPQGQPQGQKAVNLIAYINYGKDCETQPPAAAIIEFTQFETHWEGVLSGHKSDPTRIFGTFRISQDSDQWEWGKAQPWKGTRTYRLAHRSLFDCKHDLEEYIFPPIKSDLLDETSSSDAPSSQTLAAYIADNFKADMTNIVYISGHGTYGYAAEIPIHDLGLGLQKAAQITNKKPNLLLLNTCSSSFLETCCELSGKTDYLIAAQGPTYPIDSMAWEMAFHELLEKGNSAEDFGGALIKNLDGNKARTFSMIALDEIQPLRKALNNLGGVLRCRLSLDQRGQMEKFYRKLRKFRIRKALLDSRTALAEDQSSADLGLFLRRLTDMFPIDGKANKRIREALEVAQRAYSAAVVKSAAEKSFPGASGMNFGFPNLQKIMADNHRAVRNEFMKMTALNGWTAFIDHLLDLAK